MQTDSVMKRAERKRRRHWSGALSNGPATPTPLPRGGRAYLPEGLGGVGAMTMTKVSRRPRIRPDRTVPWAGACAAAEGGPWLEGDVAVGSASSHEPPAFGAPRWLATRHSGGAGAPLFFEIECHAQTRESCARFVDACDDRRVHDGPTDRVANAAEAEWRV